MCVLILVSDKKDKDRRVHSAPSVCFIEPALGVFRRLPSLWRWYEKYAHVGSQQAHDLGPQRPSASKREGICDPLSREGTGHLTEVWIGISVQVEILYIERALITVAVTAQLLSLCLGEVSD
jgi:hypothetical protein